MSKSQSPAAAAPAVSIGEAYQTLTVKDWCDYIYKWAVGKGWYDCQKCGASGWVASTQPGGVGVRCQACNGTGHETRNPYELLFLAGGELHEAGEHLREGNAQFPINQIYYLDKKNRDRDGSPIHVGAIPDGADPAGFKPDGVAVEIADAVIRLFDTAAHYNIDLPAALAAKMRYNETRPYRHGGKKA